VAVYDGEAGMLGDADVSLWVFDWFAMALMRFLQAEVE
jgi:hypothetical protein